MTRHAVLLVALLVAGCDRPPAEPRPEASTAGFDNTAAARSIMQPEVAAQNPPEAAASAAPAPPAPQEVTIAFARGAALDDAGRSALDALIARLPAGARLMVRGHSDSRGGDAGNLAQSRRRAEAVGAYLAEKGIAPARIEVIALGERRPVAPNANRDGSDDPAGRARNRRVEIEVVPAAPSSPAPPSPPAAATND